MQQQVHDVESLSGAKQTSMWHYQIIISNLSILQQQFTVVAAWGEAGCKSEKLLED